MKLPDEAFIPRLRAVLELHVGAHNPISLDALAVEAGLITGYGHGGEAVPDRRRCELILSGNVRRFPFIVCGGGKGMFVADHPDDLNHEKASRLSRIRNIAIGWREKRNHARALEFQFENGRCVAVPRQGELLLEYTK